MQTATKVSLEEFVANPDPHYYDFHELHDGEIVEVAPPTHDHVRLQKWLEKALDSLLAADGRYEAYREFYYTLPSEARRADVAVVLGSRWSGNASFSGAPDLVVEILSPSNSMTDIVHLRSVCMEGGARQFWAVDMPSQKVFVFDRNSVTEYSATDVIPLNFLSESAGSLAVKALFP